MWSRMREASEHRNVAYGVRMYVYNEHHSVGHMCPITLFTDDWAIEHGGASSGVASEVHAY